MESDLIQYAKVGGYFLGFALMDISAIACLAYLLNRNKVNTKNAFETKKRLFSLSGKRQGR